MVFMFIFSTSILFLLQDWLKITPLVCFFFPIWTHFTRPQQMKDDWVCRNEIWSILFTKSSVNTKNKCLNPPAYLLHFLAHTCIINSDILHLRLRHLSPARLQIISTFDSSIKPTHNHVCEICPLARQKKFPLPISYHQSNKVFQLIHDDIMSHFSIILYFGYKYFWEL